ncbi:MAG TPA: acyl-CoA dehydrogenase family protein [Terriglobia bacterium]|nr:acyl-CoA dehydrogenase family protein [Terriglobia bacterium]
MDFAWSEEQQALRRSLIQFAQQELTSDVIGEDHREEFSWNGWRQCAKFGIQGMPVPEEFGGGGADILTMVCALEALGYGCRNSGLIFSLNAHMWGAEIPLASFGTDAQKQALLPRLAAGELMGAFAGTEFASGSEASAPRIRAEHKGGRWVLNGSQAFVSNAPLADVIVVLAATGASGDPAGATVFVLEKAAPGFSAGPALQRMGLRTSPMGEVTLNDCEVPERSVLGEVGAGSAVLAAAQDWERICVLASHLGMMQRQLEISARYAGERRQFGQRIGKFPAIAAKIAEMDIRLETSRLVLYQAAWLKKQGKHPERETAIAKAYVAEAAIETARDALQIHGGYGYMTEYQIERELRDAIAGRIYSGSADAEKRIIAGAHGL